MKRTQWWGLTVGLLLLAVTLGVEPPADLPPVGWRVLGVTLLMAVWWTTEPIPIGVTALLPLILLPTVGAGDIGRAAAPYGSPLVFLFLGGFLLAAAVSRWGLHARIAAMVIRFIGDGPRRIVLGFMASSAFLSMWLSNTATVVLMLPVAMSVIGALEQIRAPDSAQLRRFALALLLGLAYSASIGGVGTLVGSPPNALLAAYLQQERGLDLSFVAWSAVGLPLIAAFLPLAWLVLTRVVFPLPDRFEEAIGDGLLSGLAAAGRLTTAQGRVAALLALAALSWIARPLLNKVPGLEALSDPAIGLLCGTLLFLVPSGMPDQPRPLMTWRDTNAVSWEVLLLFGGGLSVASAMDSSGLATWIGTALGAFGHLPVPVFLLLLVAVMVLITEIASNTAAVAALLPIAATVSEAAGIDLLSTGIAITLAGGCAFMLPMSTPPNALVFASGHVTAAAMLRAGLLMNLLSIALVTLAAWHLAPRIATML